MNDPIFAVVWPILVLLIAVPVFGVLFALKNGMLPQQIWKELGGWLAAASIGIVVCGAVWLVVVALWGWKPGFWVIGVFFVANLSTLLFGGFGGQWVGPGSHAVNAREAEYAGTMLLGSFLWTVVGGLLALFLTFEGWCPWPAR